MSTLPRLAIAALLVATSGLAQAQLSLTINGQTQANNLLTVTVGSGTVLTLVMDDAASPLARYGLFGAQSNNANPTGWYLDQGGGPSGPFPVVTGVDTLDLEAWLGTQGLNVDISPDRPENPLIRLNGLGQRTLSFRIPTGFTGDVFLQAVTQEAGQSGYDVSNAIEVSVVAPTTSARLLVARDRGKADPNEVDLGVLSFTGAPGSASFTQAPGLAGLRIERLGLSSVSPWGDQNANSDTQATPVTAQAGLGPVLMQENDEFPRIALPAHPGADGSFGTADDIPERDLLQVFDFVSDEGFFVIANRDANPNTPGEDFHDIAASHFSHNNTGRQPWRLGVSVSADGTTLGAILRTLAGGFDRFFLISLDGSTPYLDGGGSPSEVVEVTPVGFGESSVTAVQQSLRFTANSFFFMLDDGNDAVSGDSDGVSHVMFQAPFRVAQPTPTLLSIPTTAFGTAPDYLSNRVLVSENGSTLAFLGGNLKATVDGVASVIDADWYAIADSAPTTVTNVTVLPQTAAPAFPTLFEAGPAYDGSTGFASLSPDGSLLAFVANHDEEITGQLDDEIYVAPTDGSVPPTLGLPVTNQALFDSSTNTELDNAQDLFVINANEVLFFYGANATAHSGNRFMDLYHLDVNAGAVTNLTATSGETTPTFSVQGGIYPEGYFLSMSRRYFYFARGNGLQAGRTNLVGVDLTDGRVFNVTGSEFTGASVGNTLRLGTFGDNAGWNLRIAGGALGSLATFSAGVAGVGNARQQVWFFDTESPFGAVELSGLSGTNSSVRGLVPSQDHLGAAFGRAAFADPLTSDVNYLAVQRGVVDDLSETGAIADLAFGSIGFVPAVPPDPLGSNASPPGLIYAIGTVGPAGNPTNSRFYYVSVDGTTDMTGTQLGGVIGETVHIFHVDLP